MNFFSKILIGLISFCFTALIFMNTYEVVGNKDIPLATSVQKMHIQKPINEIVRDFSIKTGANQSDFNNKLNTLQSIEIPSIKVKVQLEEARKIDGLWYTRPSHASYLELNRDGHGTVIDYLIYTRESWRTIPDGSQISEGMDVNFFYNGGAKSTFTVAAKKLLDPNNALVLSKTETRQIVLVIEDSETEAYYGYSLVQGQINEQ